MLCSRESDTNGSRMQNNRFKFAIRGLRSSPESCKEVPLDGTFRNKLKEYSASSMGFFRRLRRNERHRLPATL